jgi:hypothetical protein
VLACAVLTLRIFLIFFFAVAAAACCNFFEVQPPRLRPHRRCPNHSFDFYFIFEIFCRSLSEQSNIGARFIVCTIMLSTPTFALFVAIALLQVLSTATFMLSVLEKEGQGAGAFVMINSSKKHDIVQVCSYTLFLAPVSYW